MNLQLREGKQSSQRNPRRDQRPIHWLAAYGRYAALLLAVGVMVWWLGGCGDGTVASVDQSIDADATSHSAEQNAKNETNSSDRSSATAHGSQKHANANTVKMPPPRFKQWPKPAVALVLSGDQHGYIEPCGCSDTLSGGLSRRADLIKQMRALNWSVAGVDVGGMIGRDRLQSRIKYEMMLETLSDLAYLAVGFGPEEIRFGPDYFLSKHQPRMGAGKGNLPEMVSANVTIYGEPALGPLRHQVATLGEIKVGISAVVSPSYRAKLFPGGTESFITIDDPLPALKLATTNLAKEKTAFNVLLAHVPLAEAKALAKQFPEFGVVLVSGGGDEPDGKPVQVGEVTIVNVGRKGKYNGVLAFYPDGKADEKTTSSPKGTPRFRFELIDLDMHRFSNNAMVETHLRKYQQDLEANLPRIFKDMPQSKHPSGATFVGAETCGDCHTKAFEKWSSTAHAHAYHSIVTGREGQYTKPISRVFDAECLVCHVTGWQPQELVRYDSGYLPEKLAEAAKKPDLYHKLKGNQCENCHGPGSQHVDLEYNSIDDDKLAAGRKQMRVTLETAKKDTCVGCHDFENSPKFDFDSYWEEIKHPWRD